MSSFAEIASESTLGANGIEIPLSKRVLRFRILCERADGTIGLIRIVGTLAETRGACKELAESHLERLKEQRSKIVVKHDRPRRLYFERWVGAEHCGFWEMVDPSKGGFAFTFLDRAPKVNGAPGTSRPKAKSNSCRPSSTSVEKISELIAPSNLGKTIHSGSIVRCELLSKRTRKGGWFAKVISHDVCGPITNSQMMPQHLIAGDCVSLRVCGVKVETGFVQLSYCEISTNLDKFQKD